MRHELPPLPYAKEALEPHISAETLEYHHGKHHQKYVSKLNDLIEGTEHADRTLEEIIGAAGSGPLFNNAAQVWNHTFYWNSLSPQGGGEPGGPLGELISANFGSYADFTKAFTQAVSELFGSGWVWLVKDGESAVSILSTKDADNPLAHGRIALLACDVWEHAFYIDYRNDKAGYMDGFWKVVNWPFAQERFAADKAGL